MSKFPCCIWREGEFHIINGYRCRQSVHYVYSLNKFAYILDGYVTQHLLVLNILFISKRSFLLFACGKQTESHFATKEFGTISSVLESSIFIWVRGVLLSKEIVPILTSFEYLCGFIFFVSWPVCGVEEYNFDLYEWSQSLQNCISTLYIVFKIVSLIIKIYSKKNNTKI